MTKISRICTIAMLATNIVLLTMFLCPLQLHEKTRSMGLIVRYELNPTRGFIRHVRIGRNRPLELIGTRRTVGRVFADPDVQSGGSVVDVHTVERHYQGADCVVEGSRYVVDAMEVFRIDIGVVY